MVGKYFLIVLVSLLFISCQTGKNKSITRVEFSISAARDRMVYIETIPYNEEKTKRIDSLLINSGNFKGILTIKNFEERPMQLLVSGTDIRIRFVNDAPEISIKAQVLQSDKYIIENSPANALLENFYKGQSGIVETSKQIGEQLQKIKSREENPILFDSLMRLSDQSLQAYFDYVKNFADTVSSPGVFLNVYNNVDFGNDYKGLEAFINRAAARFPSHSRVQKLKDETIAFLKIVQEEFEIGQQLPEIQLMDTSGFAFSTGLTKGKYVFLDIWASWCRPCQKYDLVKLDALNKFSKEKLDIVTIGLEPDKVMWKNYIRAKKLNWIQLVDEKIWNGTTQRTFKIDSIPFNFLLDPQGRIVRKAIPADSVIAVLSGYMK